MLTVFWPKKSFFLFPGKKREKRIPDVFACNKKDFLVRQRELTKFPRPTMPICIQTQLIYERFEHRPSEIVNIITFNTI